MAEEYAKNWEGVGLMEVIRNSNTTEYEKKVILIALLELAKEEINS